MSIQIGTSQISSIYLGEMGIKSAYAGDTKIYDRPGGYFYLELETKGEMNNG